MNHKDFDLVRVATAGSAMEAHTLRGYLETHNIFCHAQGIEHHSMLGGHYNGIIEINLLVPAYDAEQAGILIAEFRAGDLCLDENDPASWGGDEADRETSDNDYEYAPEASTRWGRNLNVAGLLSVAPSFGAGHFYVGALVRGMILLCMQITGIWSLFQSNLMVGFVLIIGAIIVDFFGSRRYIADTVAASAQGLRVGRRSRLPRARVAR